MIKIFRFFPGNNDNAVFGVSTDADYAGAFWNAFACFVFWITEHPKLSEEAQLQIQGVLPHVVRLGTILSSCENPEVMFVGDAQALNPEAQFYPELT